jgi:hypothetical protein
MQLVLQRAVCAQRVFQNPANPCHNLQQFTDKVCVAPVGPVPGNTSGHPSEFQIEVLQKLLTKPARDVQGALQWVQAYASCTNRVLLQVQVPVVCHLCCAVVACSVQADPAVSFSARSHVVIVEPSARLLLPAGCQRPTPDQTALLQLTAEEACTSKRST